MGQLTTVNQKATVKQSNNLTVARYALSLNEQRLMYAICSQIDKNANEFEKIRFPIDDLAELCNIHGKRKYEDIRKISIKLLKRIVAIPTADGGEYVTHWLQSQRYYPSDTSIEFKIDSDLKGELLQLKKAYVNTPVSMLTSFKKKYSSRMYLILKKMIKVGDFEYRLDFFRDAFQLADTYNKFSNIKNGVIEPALQELNETSDLDIEHDYIKEGRFYTKIHFTIKSKNKEDEKEKETIEPQGNHQETPEEKLEKIGQVMLIEPPANTKPRGLTDEQEIVYDRLINRGIWGKTAEEIVRTYDAKRIMDNMELARKQLPADDDRLPGLIISYIKSDRVAEKKLEKKQAQEREAQRQKDRRQAYEMFHPDLPQANAGTPTTTTSVKADELSPIEAELVKMHGKATGKVAEKMERLGLTLEDVKAGKRK